MLRQLYELGLKGHPQEFLSYRIIYLLHTRNRSGMSPPSSTYIYSPPPGFPNYITLSTRPQSGSSSPSRSLSYSPHSTKLFKLDSTLRVPSLTNRYGSPPSPTHTIREIRSRSPPRTSNSRITSYFKLRPFLPFIQHCPKYVGVYIGSFRGEGTDECFDYYVQGVSPFLFSLLFASSLFFVVRPSGILKTVGVSWSSDTWPYPSPI